MFGARHCRAGRLLGLTLLATALAGSVATAAADHPLEADLLEVKGETVKLGKGSRAGVVIGQVFDLYQEARVYMLPLTSGDVPLVKSNRRVARVQVFQVEPTTAMARIISHEHGPDGTPIELVPGHLRAIHNPDAVAPNRRPEFLPPQPFKPVPWRQTVPIDLKVSNEADDRVVYTWTVTGGQLAQARTLTPSNRWTAPPRAGTYRLMVTAQDSANNFSRYAIDLVSSGLAGAGHRAPTRYTPGRAFDGSSRYGFVSDLAFDSLGRHYFLHPKRHWGGTPVIRVETPDQLLSLPVSDHTFTALAVADPQVGMAGALYALDADSKTVLRYSFSGVSWDQVLKRKPLVLGRSDGGPGNARFDNPVDLVVSRRGEVYVLDAAQRSVQVFSIQSAPGKDDQALFLVSFGRPGKGNLQLQDPRALAIAPDDTVYVLDNGRKEVVVYRGWRPVNEFNVGGPQEELTGITVDPYSGDLYVLDRAGGVVERYDRNGTLKGRFGDDPRQDSPERLQKPTRIRMDPTRVLWVLDRDGASLVRFDADGNFLGRTGGVDLSGPLRIAGIPSGGFAALDRGDYRVTCFDAAGWITARFGGEGSKPGQFEDPVDVAVSRSGDVFVLDADSKSIQRFSPGGAYLGSFGRPGNAPNELQGVMDLSMVNDRSYLAVLQQRSKDNFNLFSPGTGDSVRTWGQYTGDLTPRFGCVTGVDGSLGRGGRESASPWFWTVDDDRERVYRGRPGVPPAPVGTEFDEITDIEASVADQVFVTDPGDYKVVVLASDGNEVVSLKGDRFEKPWDVGLDDYGVAYVYDKSSKKVVELVPAD